MGGARTLVTVPTGRDVAAGGGRRSEDVGSAATKLGRPAALRCPTAAGAITLIDADAAAPRAAPRPRLALRSAATRRA